MFILILKIPQFSNLTLSSLFLVVVVLAAIFTYAANAISKWSNATLTISIRKRLLNHYFNLDYSFFTKNKYGDIISRVITDSKSVAQGVVPVLQSLFHQGSLVLVYSIFLFKKNNLIFFASFLIFIIQYIIMLFLKKPIKDSLINVNNKTAELLSILGEVFSAIRITKVFNMRSFQFNKLNYLQKEERKFGFRAAIIDELQTPISSILTSLDSNNFICNITSNSTKQYYFSGRSDVCNNWKINHKSCHKAFNDIYLDSIFGCLIL